MANRSTIAKRKRRWRHLAVAAALCAAATAAVMLAPASRQRFRPLGGGRQVRLEVTAYCACGTCCGWRRDWLGRPVVAAGSNQGQPKKIGICADGSRVAPGVAAADVAHFPFGTRLHVPGYGIAVVRDTGGDIKGPTRLDLFFVRHRDARRWGRQTLVVTVYD